jgi:hypothetical protein
MQLVWGYLPNVYLAMTGLDKIPSAIYFLSQIPALQWNHGIGFSLSSVHDKNMEIKEIKAQWQEEFLALEERIQEQVLYASAHSPDHQGGENLPFVESIGRLRAPLISFLEVCLIGVESKINAELKGI